MSSKNFMNYEDATTVLGKFAEAIKDKQGTITAGLYIQKSGDTISVKRDVSEDVDEILTLTQDGYNLIATLSIDGTVIESETFTQAGGTFIDLIAIDFNIRAVRWHYTYLKASKNHGVGYDDYIYSSPYTDTFVVTIGEENKLIIKSELEDAMSTKQDTLTFDDVPTANSNNPVKSGGVKSAIDAAVSSAYHHAGTKTCVELVAGLLVAANEGNVYNMTDSGTTTADFIEGAGQPIKAGDNVGIAKISDGVYKFDLLSGFVDTSNFVQKSVTAGLLKNDGTVNDEIEGDIGTLKSGLTNLDNEVNGDATTYPYADVITIEDAIPANVAECSVKIEPVQDLHGYDKPWVGGAGKNKLITPDLATLKSLNTSGTWSDNKYTYNGVTYTVITDNDGNITGINANGTATGGLSDFFFTTNVRKTLDNYGLVVGNSYIFTSGLVSDVSGVIMMFNGTASNIEASASGRTFTVNSTDVYSINIRVYNNNTVNNVLFKPMVRLSTETDATFAPYTNICPISGHTEASVQRDGANIFDPINVETFDATGQGDMRYGHRYNTGTYTIVNNMASESIFVRQVKNDLSEYGQYSTINALNHATINVNDGYMLYVYYQSLTEEQRKNVCVNKGNDTTFEPYAGKTYTIALGDTIYGGTVDFDSGVMTVDRAFAQLNGSDSTGWERRAAYGTSTRFDYSGLLVVPNTPENDGIANYLTMGNIGTNDLECFNFHATTKALQVQLHTDRLATDDVTGLMAYLASNPLQVCYELATPTTIQLTPQQIQLLKGQNTLTASTGDISVTVNGVSGSIGAVQEQVNDHEERIEVVESGLNNLIKSQTITGTTDAYGDFPFVLPSGGTILMAVRPLRDIDYYDAWWGAIIGSRNSNVGYGIKAIKDDGTALGTQAIKFEVYYI